MKIYAGSSALKGVTLHTDSDDATMKASDLQQGITAYAGGRKITGSGKSFEFANYGTLKTNVSRYVPTEINIIELSSSEYPVKLTVNLTDIKQLDFSKSPQVATVTINGSEHGLSVIVASNMLKVLCDLTVTLQVFYGKDNYT